VLSKAIEVLALLLELGLELQKLLLLALTDGVVLVGLLTALPGIAKTRTKPRKSVKEEGAEDSRDKAARRTIE
jgi:hypothetical protein